MGVSKVVYGDDTLVDLTGDTVTPTSLTLGATAHGADGEPIVGEYQYVLPPMSATTRGGARIQPDSGLEITDTDNLQVRLALESDGTVRGGIAELTAKGHAEQDGTPTPDNPVPIQVVRGRNLCDTSTITDGTQYNTTRVRNADGSIMVSTGTSTTGTQIMYNCAEVSLPAGTYTLSGCPSGGSSSTWFIYIPSTYIAGGVTDYGSGATFTISEQTTVKVVILIRDGKTINATFKPQLTLGSTPQPYVPYGHVGMEARDPNTNTLIFCTPIPLPSRGWVAGLPDGTADSLRLDGAGHVEWTLPTGEVVLDGSSDENWDLSGSSKRVNYKNLSTVIKKYDGNSLASLLSSHFNRATSNQNYGGTISMSIGNEGYIGMCRTGEATTLNAEMTWLSTNNVTVLYPIATPVTEDCGYVEDWPTDIPEGAVITIPELDAVGVKYFIDSAVTELARQWYARAYAELGDAVTELAGRVAALES